MSFLKIHATVAPSAPADGAELFLGVDGAFKMIDNLGVVYVFDYGGMTGFANPSVAIGLTAVNGVATTVLRSDSAPALSQAINPAWTGAHHFSNAAGIALDPHGVAAGNTMEIRFSELVANGANYVGFKAPDAIAANQIWVLPSADGAANTYLKTNAGVLSFAAISESEVTNLVADLGALSSAIALRELLSNKGAVSGYASLDGTTKIPIAQIPTGSSATTVTIGNDSRLSDSRTPTAHATTHKSGGSDAIKLDELDAPTDIATLNASITAHGLLKKLPNVATQYMDGTGNYTVPAGTFTGGDVPNVLRMTGAANPPVAGSGLEIFYSGGVGYIYPYDRGGSTYLPMSIGGSNLQMHVAGNIRVYLDSTRFTIGSDHALGWANTPGANGTIGAAFYREADNIIVQRNGVNAQSHSIYGTYTDVNNWERWTIKHGAASLITFTSEALGTGTARDFQFVGSRVGFGRTPNEVVDVNGNIRCTRLGINTLASATAYIQIKIATDNNCILRPGTDFGGSYTGVAWDSVNDAITSRNMMIVAGAPVVVFGGNFGIGLVPTAVLHLKAGTAAANTAPQKFTSGTLQTTAEAGTEEYDGKAFYASPVASNRGVLPATHFISQTADFTGTNVNTAQPVFGGTLSTITLPASTSYMFELVCHIHTTGTTSHTFALLFGGTATLTSIGYRVNVTNDATEVFGPANTMWVSVATATVLTAAAATATHHTIRARGIVRINGAGTLIPQYQWSAAPGVAGVTLQNSFFSLSPIGDNVAAAVGNWS